MKVFRFFVAFAIWLSVVVAHAQLQTVPYVDPARYVGTWYEIASNPLPFQGGCVCSRQQLEAREDGLIGVSNSCNNKTPEGPLREIRGTAENADPATNSKFLVDFGFPRKGDYWIIGLEANYQYAVVSDPSQRSLYILSKTPVLDPALYQQAVTEAAKQVDVSKLVVTEQRGCTYPAMPAHQTPISGYARVQPPSDPAHPGSPVYGTTSGAVRKDIKCAGRDVTVYLPTDPPSAGSKYAAVVFGHGQALNLDNYEQTFQHLARKGVASVYPTYDNGFFDQDWNRMGRDYLTLTDCAITTTGDVIARDQLVFSGHSKGAYVASIAAGLAEPVLPQLRPKSLVIFATAGFDSASAKTLSPKTDVTLVFSDRDTVVKRSFTDSFYAAAKSPRKQIIFLKSYPQDAGTSGVTADHFWSLTKGSFAGGGPVGPLHYYGSWKWLTAAAKGQDEYIFGAKAVDKGLPGLEDSVTRP